MTSAPRSARMVVATGPAMKLAASMTRRPSSSGTALIGSRGGPRYGPPRPPTLGAPRGTRGAPRSRARSSARAAWLAQQPQREQCDADGDRRIGDVEGRPVPGTPVHVHEVHHGAEARAVDQVADGAAE